jgi:hypothetical protein
MNYIYSGPLSGITVEDRELMLSPGSTVNLPDSEYVHALVAQGLLTPVAKPRPEPDPKPDLKQRKKDD